jgi:hypothetical protein
LKFGTCEKKWRTGNFLQDDQEDTTGWKLVHGDVFRPPKHGAILAPILGSGIQFLFMIVITMSEFFHLVFFFFPVPPSP